MALRQPPFFKGGIRGDLLLPIPQVKEGLRRVRAIAGDTRISLRRRRNEILRACGLESTFAPKVVLENLRRDSEGNMLSIATGCDGRILWKGKSKELRNLKEGSFKFTFPWAAVDGSVRRKSARFSYLVHCLAMGGFREEAIKPLARLCTQIWNLRWLDFVGLVRKVLSLSKSRFIIVDGSPSVYRMRTNPRRSDEWKNLGGILGSVPLWWYRRTVRPLLCPKDINPVCAGQSYAKS